MDGLMVCGGFSQYCAQIPNSYERKSADRKPEPKNLGLHRPEKETPAPTCRGYDEDGQRVYSE